MVSNLMDTLKNEWYQELVMRCYKLVVKTLLLLSIVSFIVDPFGRLLLSYDGYSISSVTILTFTASILILISLFDHVPPLPRILCSLSLPVLGMSFHEALWHLGCQMVWGTGFSRFWVLYTIAIGVGTYVLHIKWDILSLNPYVVGVVGCLVILCVFDWLRITNLGFYQILLLYERGLGPNPHTPALYASASLSRMLWLLLVRGGERNE